MISVRGRIFGNSFVRSNFMQKFVNIDGYGMFRHFKTVKICNFY